jgi:hypothetical protein
MKIRDARNLTGSNHGSFDSIRWTRTLDEGTQSDLLRLSDARVGGGGMVRILRCSNNMGLIDKLRYSTFQDP